MTINAEEGDVLVRVWGIVPAKEFQPFVVRSARRLRIRGWVTNDARGALIRAVGVDDAIAALVRAIRDAAPPAMRVRAIETELLTEGMPSVGERFCALPSGPEFHGSTSMPPLARVA
jgi:hydrogenase maturation factor HypF (carbamoyltransferase family)